jgi:uncharacterized ion transporter superfamily protein YfcC
MENTASIQKKAFFSAIIILFSLLLITGILTFFIPSGSYQYEVVDGVEVIVPDSFAYTDQGHIAWYRIFTAPFEVFTADGSAIVIAIILFLLIIGGSIKVLNKIGVIEHIIFTIIQRFKDKKYVLLSMITLIFMSIGAFVGVFEEVVPLVPIMIVLSKKLGWDTKIGLGMSILAAGFGFSAAITNPFTIGVAQELASIPIFSGFFYRFIIFIITFVILDFFLIYHAKKIDTHPSQEAFHFDYQQPTKRALRWTMFWFGLMLISIVLSPFVPFLQDYNLILIAMYFLIAGVGAGLLSNLHNKEALKVYASGALDMAPGVLLIMLATGIRHLITISGVMDTILFHVVSLMNNQTNFIVILGAFLFTLVANFFIGSGSAKAFIIIPILNPLLDLSNISRQLGVLAFQLGDGFSNMFYPTNAVLLVALGLGSFAYTKWFKWTILLQLSMILLSILFLFIGLQIGY